jgi:hypothetical protein
MGKPIGTRGSAAVTSNSRQNSNSQNSKTPAHWVGADLFYRDLNNRRLAATKQDEFRELPGVSDQSVAVWQMEAQRVDQKTLPITPVAEREMCQQMGLLDAFELAA